MREIEKFNGDTSVRETIDNEGDLFFLFCNYANNVFIMINHILKNPSKITKTLVLMIECVCGVV